MFFSLIPSSLVRLIHSNCRKVTESSTIRTDLLPIAFSSEMVSACDPLARKGVRHPVGAPGTSSGTQQMHKALDRFQLAVGRRVEFRTDERRRRVAGQQLE